MIWPSLTAEARGGGIRSTVSAPLAAQTPEALARALADHRAPRGRIDCAGDHQTRIVDHAIRISESRPKRPLQGVADRVMGDVDRGRARQAAPRRQAVVDIEPESSLPRQP